MKNKKLIRVKVWEKYGGFCAYCGCKLTLEKTHIDHIQPKYLLGTDGIDNLNPSCQRCNTWKKTFSIEEFRQEIKMQIDRLRKNVAGFRLAEDFYMIEAFEELSPQFYFEKNKLNS